MNHLLAVLLILALLFVLLGNRHLGPRVYQDYSFGDYPSIVGLVIAIVVVFLLLGGHIR